ncbi:hypothetical protein Tco_1574811, partial [Tanacetum coccineum]
MSALAFNLPDLCCRLLGCSHSFCPKKQGSLGEYQHCPSSFNKSAIPSFNNAILLRSSQNGLLV